MFYIGIDIGGTKCAVGLGAAKNRLEVLRREEIATVGKPMDMLEKLAAIARRLAADRAIRAIGVSCGGPLNSRNGVILCPPNLPGWENVPVTEFFAARFSVPAYLVNDANASALAEWKYGAGRGLSDLVFLTFGTGLGGGIIAGGRLLEGANDNAGEIGHVRLARTGPVGYGKEGSAEGYCSGGGIARLAQLYCARQERRGETPELVKRAGSRDEITAKLVAQAAREGDATAQKVMKTAAHKLGETLSVLIDVLNPQAIIIGGVYMRCRDLLEKNALRVVRREALAESLTVFSLLPAGLGERIGDYAALSAAVYREETEAEKKRAVTSAL